jgi:signal transduction histidine kinase/CheY-like chemotaxis protein
MREHLEGQFPNRSAHLYAATVARVTDNFRTVVTSTVALSAALLIARTSRGGSLASWGLLAALCGALWALRQRPRLATGLALGLLEIVLVASLLNFGPMAGTGALVAVGVLLATVHFSRASSLGFAVLATATICAVGVFAVRHGLGETTVPLSTWMRTGVICGVISLFIALATSSLLGGLRGALAELEALQMDHEQTQAELARHRELETAGRLISGVAHDVNNSLTVMACCASELQHEELSKSARDLVNDIEATAQAAAGTMQALLDLVRADQGDSPRCDPAGVIVSAVRNLRRLLPDDVKLATSLVEGHTVPLSRGAVLQSVLNLVLNARDALAEDPKEISVTVAPSEGSVVIAVRDTGTGMSPATLARMGEEFFSTKGQAGTGLGLSMVRATVERCGGRVVFDSEPGRGTEVRLVLPSVAPSADPAAEQGAGDVKGKRVLLVEDDDAIRRAFARGLSSAGALVTEAPTVASALAVLEATGPAFDILVTDGILGDGTVGDVLAPFHDRCPGSPVLLCTAHGAEVFTARGVALAGTTVVSKPMSGAQLAQAAARTMRKSEGRLVPRA